VISGSIFALYLKSMKRNFVAGFFMIWAMFYGFGAMAQEAERLDDSTATGTQKIKTIDIPASGTKGEVDVKADGRLEAMSKFMGTPVGTEPTVKLRGFRLQLMFGNDKDIVSGARADFMAKYPKIPVYPDYLAPNFRLRVGDFKTRLQAEELQNMVREMFPDAIVVEEWIELPVLRTE
jgi:hypothetical protein